MRQIVFVVALCAAVIGGGCKSKKDESSGRSKRTKKAPEVKLAANLDGLSDIMEKHMDSPAEGIQKIRAYVRENLPEIAEDAARIVAALDEKNDDDRVSYATTVIGQVEKPMNRLAKVGKMFGRNVGRDEDAENTLKDMAEEYEGAGKVFSKLARQIQRGRAPESDGKPSGEEAELAGHAAKMIKIMEANMDEPADGIAALRSYLREEGPEMAGSMATLLVEVDQADGEAGKRARMTKAGNALAGPIAELMEVTSDFGRRVMKDDAASEVLSAAGRGWAPTAKRLAKAATGGAFTKYMNRAKTTEAIDQLDKIYKSAANYYTAPRVARGTGVKLPCQFPRTQALTPDVRNKACCGGKLDRDGDNRCDVDTTQWVSATWSALNFQMNDQHYFGYSFTSSGTLANAKFTASAHADLDCNGVLSTFERYGYGDSSASHAECSMKGSSAFYKNNETE